MNKQEAIARLDALDREAKELRKIIERPDRLVYDNENMYVAIILNQPYILAGHGVNKYFSWHSFESNITEQTWSSAKETGQSALDNGQRDGEVHVFTDAREGFKFFLEHYKR